MPRKKRDDAPGRLHHIMNRGIAKRVVFPDHAAKRRFALLLACSVRRGELEVEAFCIMDTHFHLLARSPDGRIHYPLMRVLNSYARYFNRRYRRDGPVFRARYASWPVKTFLYWRILVRYIDFNPVKARICAEPALYPYGSARLYAMRSTGPQWLARSSVEGHVAFCVRAAVYRGADYLRVFGQQLTESEAQVVERRIRGRARDEDPLDALRFMPPPRVAAWMRRKARLADDLSPWAPILGTSCIRQHLAELKGREHVYRVRPGRNQIDAWPLLEVGLLHGAAGLCLQEIARLVGCSGSTAGIRLQRHRQVLAGDDAYALRSGQILKTLLDAAYPLGIPA